MFPKKISLSEILKIEKNSIFFKVWKEFMINECHDHPLWNSNFVTTLKNEKSDSTITFQLAATWSINMVSGSYCFPRYVSAIAARAEQDSVRYGLIENAWDESGSFGHESRSHFWLAVKLAKLLGLSDNEIENIIPIKESSDYTDEHYKQCASGDFAFSLGMICLIEEFTTPEFTMILKAFLRSVKDGLGSSQEEFILNGGAEYFTANISDDERHREEMPRIVATLLKENGTDLNNEIELREEMEKIRSGIRYSADLRNKFFDGIYEYISAGNTYKDLIKK